MATKYDVVWYWTGGNEVGQWNPADPGKDINQTIAEIERMGYVAHRGLQSIGAPEGPPSDSDFRRIYPGWKGQSSRANAT